MYYLNTDLSKVYIRVYYRNFMSKDPCVSHVGLGVNGTHTIKCLRKEGIRSDLIPVWETNASDIDKDLTLNKEVTHAIIEAPYIDSNSMRVLIKKHPHVCFVCRIHSQVGFLQVEAGAIKLIREYIHLQEQEFNFVLSCNNIRLSIFLHQAYNAKPVLLPNLYFIDKEVFRPHKQHQGIIRAGSFGAIRIQKNHSTSAAAALLLAKMHKFHLNFYMSVNREEHGKGVLQSIRNMFENLPYATLIEIPWQTWSQFKQYVAQLDIHFQLSMSETFNITVADAISSGVPSVVGHSIEWVPKNWMCDIDDAYQAADVAYKLLIDPYAAQRGFKALSNYNQGSIFRWKNFLSGQAHHLDHLDQLT